MVGILFAVALVAAFFLGVIVLAVRSVWLKQSRDVELSNDLKRAVDGARRGGAQVGDDN